MNPLYEGGRGKDVTRQPFLRSRNTPLQVQVVITLRVKFFFWENSRHIKSMDKKKRIVV